MAALVDVDFKAYQAAWDAVLHSDDCDLFAARDVAYSWHGGQSSALYSFASTECTVWNEAHRAALVTYVENVIATVRASPSKYYDSWDDVDQYTRERFQSGTPESEWGTPLDAGLESLENLLRCIRALPVKYTNG